MLSLCYLDNLEQLIQQGKVSEDTIDKAVYRILLVKFKLGLFEHPYAEEGAYERTVLLPVHRDLARKLAATPASRTIISVIQLPMPMR